MKKTKSKPAVPEEVKCGCCDKPIELSENEKLENLLCAGCGKHICERDTCSASPWGKGHESWKHTPCNVCGEPVDDPGAERCENCQ